MFVVRDTISTQSELKYVGYSDSDGFFNLNIPVNNIGEDVIYIDFL